MTDPAAEHTPPPITSLARPMPRVTAQVEPYVAILGPELTVTFLLHFGGAGLYLSKDPKGRGALEALVGHEKAKALANTESRSLQHRVPLAKRWLAQMLHWRGHSGAQIARTLRTSDTVVYRWLKDAR